MAGASLIGAWSAWMDGRPTADLELWGLRVLWWGRIGKIAEFAGALTVVLDIIGADRLRAWGRGLRERRGPARIRARTLWRKSHLLPFALTRQLWTERVAWEQLKDTPIKDRGPLRERRRQQQAAFDEQYPIGCLPWLVGTATSIAAAVLVLKHPPQPSWLTLMLVSVLTLSFLFVGLVIALLALASVALGLLVDVLVARPIAAALDSAEPGASVKWLGVVLLTLGFHFDLLAS